MRVHIDWLPQFRGAVLELAWPQAADLITGREPVNLEAMSATVELLDVLLKFLRHAPMEQQHRLQAQVRVAGEILPCHNPELWRASAVDALWTHLAGELAGTARRRDFRAAYDAVARLMLLPMLQQSHRRLWRRTILQVAAQIGTAERTAGYNPGAATDITIPWPPAVADAATVGGTLFLADVFAALQESGLHVDEVGFLLTAAFRHAWWPTWRTFQFPWYIKPHASTLLSKMVDRPERWPNGAAIHLRAIVDGRAFPTPSASWEA